MKNCAYCNHTHNDDAAKFCVKCGSRIIEDAKKDKVSDRLKLWGGESRILSVFFAAFSGFEQLISEQKDRDIIISLHNAMLKIDEIIKKYGGISNQIIPDTRTLGIFGAPKTHADDPLRVVRCAWEIKQWWEEEKSKNDLFARISLTLGVNTGRAFYGYVLERFSFLTVIGDMINTAARLTEVCPPNQILLSEHTLRHVEDHVKTEHMGERSVKGRRAKISIYLIKGLEEKKERVVTQKTPFCGRESELDKLLKIADSLTSKKAEFCIISGQMGIGKSRLKEEFERSLQERDNYFIIETHCSVEVASPYYPFRFMLQQYMDLQDFSNHDVVVQKLYDFLSEKGLSANNIKGLKNLFLTDLQRLSYEEIREVHESICIAVRNIIRQECQDKAFVLVFEEFNRADERTIQLITYLVLELRNESVMFLMVNASRDFVSHIEIPIKEINLSPLSMPEVRALVQSVLKKTDEKLVEFVYKSGGGNPLFTIETIRNTQRTRLIKKVNDTWVLEREQRLPFLDDLYGVVMSTIDSLPMDCRLVVDYAAVIGYNFNLNILQELLRKENLIEHLRFLIEEGYIVQSRKGNDPVYVFRHNLLKDAAYTVLPLRKRKEIHRKVASLFEKIYQDQLSLYYENIGHHYMAGDEYSKAGQYYKYAGDKAKNLFAIDQAIQFYEMVFKLDKQSGHEIDDTIIQDIYLNYTDIYELSGEIQKMEKATKQGLEIATRKGDEKGTLTFQERYASALLLGYQFDKAEDLLLSIVEKCEAQMNELCPVLYSELGLLYQYKYEYERGMLNYNISWNLAKKNKSYRAELSCLYNLARLHTSLANYEQAIDYLNFGLDDIVSSDDLRWRILFRYMNAVIYQIVGNTDTAMQILGDCFRLSDDIGNFEIYIKSALDLAILHIDKNETDDAQDYLANIDQKISYLIEKNILAEINLKKAIAYYHNQKPKKAHDFAVSALKNAEKFRQREIECSCYLILSRTDDKKSIDYAEKAQEIAEMIKLPPMIGQVLYRLTEIFHGRNDTERARYYGRKALLIYDDIKFRLKDVNRQFYGERPEYKKLLEI